MFDLSFPELFFVIIVAILVVGPQDIPKVLYGLGRIVRRVQYMRFSFSRQFEDFMQQHSDGDTPNSVNFETIPPKPSLPLEDETKKDMGKKHPPENDRDAVK
ncbi:MAG: hypothetical protein H6862_06595 [Rhodospirillales bacterium]|nr:hypothetical protein [Rhodospirillales bacterium]